MNNQLTILLFTYNSERDIEECLQSLSGIDTILVIGHGSTDNSLSILKKNNIPICIHPYTGIVEKIRSFGISKVTTEWLFIIDADERVTPELAKEIQSVVEDPKSYTHLKVKRKEIFAKRTWLRHGGWWPNHQIRLIHKNSFKKWPEAIHSTPEIDGEMGYLHHDLLHFSQNDWSEIVEKTVKFESAEADLLHKAGRPVNVAIFFRKFMGELWRRLIKGGGYLDGTVGIIESVYQAYSKTVTYIFLYEKTKKSRTL